MAYRGPMITRLLIEPHKIKGRGSIHLIWILTEKNVDRFVMDMYAEKTLPHLTFLNSTDHVVATGRPPYLQSVPVT